MNTILHKLPGGGVGVYPPNPEVIAVMTGVGLGYSPEFEARQIANFMQPAPDVGWPGFSQQLATEWVLAVSRGGLTETQALSLFTRRIQARRGYTVSTTIDDATLPYHITGDRYFRDAVVWDDTVPNKCRCDMPRARVIHMDRIREVRDIELAGLDGPEQVAIRRGDTVEVERIRALKQRLADIPQTLDLSVYQTPEDLKAAWPAELPPRMPL